MLETVEFRNVAGALLTLPLEDVVSGYLLDDVQGLDPVKAVLVSSSSANIDGSQYQSARREDRNLKFIIGLEPNFSVGETVRMLRTALYGFLMPKSEVTMKFTLIDGLEVEIKGRVETFETAIFSKDPAVEIVVLCFDPDFIDPIPVTLSGNTVSDMTETLIAYPGTVETGIELTININRTVSEITVYHRPADGTTRTLNFAESLVAGDILKISTVVGNKYATLTRLGVTSSILNGVSPQSNWVELQNGNNYIRVYAEGAAIPYTISYIKRHGGL